jgi:hypothetical protein
MLSKLLLSIGIQIGSAEVSENWRPSIPYQCRALSHPTSIIRMRPCSGYPAASGSRWSVSTPRTRSSSTYWCSGIMPFLRR